MQPHDLNDVQIFAAISEASTLSSVARELRVPASTISRSLTRLEKRLGVTLVQRNARGFVLTDVGKRYLNTCKRALRTLNEGEAWIDSQRSQPSGLIKVACPVTFARDILAPLLKEFLGRFPELRVHVEPYASGCDLNPREDVDVFFKVRAPRDSARHIRPYPGNAIGLFASRDYVQAHSSPSTPDDLIAHRCIGSGQWKLNRGNTVVTPNLSFCVETYDPHIHLTLVMQGLGICELPLWMARWPEVRNKLVPILPQWVPEPVSMWALFFGQANQTPKVQALLDFPCGVHRYRTRSSPPSEVE